MKNPILLWLWALTHGVRVEYKLYDIACPGYYWMRHARWGGPYESKRAARMAAREELS